MDRIEEIKKKLYKDEKKNENGDVPSGVLFESKKEKFDIGDKWSEDIFKKKKLINLKFDSFFFRKVIWGIITTLFVLLSMAVYGFWRGYTSFDIKNVDFKITGPEDIMAGEEHNYKIILKNNSRVDLLDVVVVVRFPEGSQKDVLFENIAIGKIMSGEEVVKEFSVKTVGAKYEKKEFKAEVSYQPNNFSSRFSNQASYVSTIISLPLSLNFDIPDSVVRGQSVFITVKYFNNSLSIFPSMKLKLEYPIDFKIISSEPLGERDKDNEWNIGDIAPGSEGKIIVYGILSESNTQQNRKVFKAELGREKEGRFISYADEVDYSEIVVPPLLITQDINNKLEFVAGVGDALSYRIKYKNTSNADFSQVIVTSKLDGEALDRKSLRVEDGYYDERQGLIIWNAASASSLRFVKSGDEGFLFFSVKVRDKLPIDTFDDKNYTISNLVSITSPMTPLELIGTKIDSESQLSIKINTNIISYTDIYYNDSLIENSGPIPLRLGQPTTFTVVWKMMNISNDLSNVVIKTGLPANVRWTGKTISADGGLSFNPASGEVAWDLGNVSAATGILLPTKQVAFQIEVVPSASDVGKNMKLMQKTEASGRDNFTGVMRLVENKEITSSEVSDLGWAWDMGKVFD